MMRSSHTKNNYVPIIMMFSIMIQPILDLLTTFSKVIYNIDITPGMVIRFSFMLIGGMYILIKSVENKEKGYISYLLSLAIFFIVNLIVSYYNKPIFNLTKEVTAIGKIVYFVVMFIVFIISFREIRKNNIESKYFPINIAISQFIVVISMVVSGLTNTHIEAYDGVLKSGHSGWYFAANELGTLLAVCYPILIWISLKQKTIIRIILSWLLVLGATYSLIAVGTKVGYLAIAITLVIVIVAFSLEWLLVVKRSIQNYSFLKAGLILATFATFILFTPQMPVTQNTLSHIRFVDETNQQVTDNVTEKEQKEVISEVIYSGRDSFRENHKQDYAQNKYAQRIFGMGYGGNYTNKASIVERDFHDIFYQYGWLGTIIIFLPFLYYGLKLILKILKKNIELLNVKYMMIASGILLGFGIAYVSGHTLTAPAVSTYLVLLLAYIIVDLE